ncbi:hypothetical protein [Rhodococcoides navarretei]|uniref:Glycosyltransferase RgtA/B/C/D-like domain-containing protein n=1 Tax=Rhodococcus navarretei TaxID=3128981 RepID=A0ABU9D1H9_9NOCA
MVTALLTVQFVLLKDALIDDAYIGLGYAQNFGFHFQWALVESIPSNTATSALNVIASGTVTALVRDPVLACGIVYVMSGSVLAVSLRQVFVTVNLPPRGGVLAAGLVLVNPLMMSTIGMESTLLVAVLGVSLLSIVRSRPVSFGVAAALLVLTRPDTILLLLPLALSFRALRAQWVRALAAFASICGAWYLISWILLGSVIPDTFFIKAVQRSWEGETFANGVFLFLQRTPTMTIMSIVPVVAGASALLFSLSYALYRRYLRPELRVFVSAAVGGLLVFAGYSVIGVPPYHWYFVPTVATLSIFLVAFVYTRTGILHAVGVAVLVTAIVVSGAVIFFRADKAVPPITTNWTSAQQYEVLGRELGALVGTELVELDGEAGTIAYYCRCRAVNVFSDQGFMNARIQEQQSQIPSLAKPILDVNWHFRDWSRGQQPTRYFLAASTEPGPPGAIRSWRVTSQWIGERYYSLYYA